MQTFPIAVILDGMGQTTKKTTSKKTKRALRTSYDGGGTWTGGEPTLAVRGFAYATGPARGRAKIEGLGKLFDSKVREAVKACVELTKIAPDLIPPRFLDMQDLGFELLDVGADYIRAREELLPVPVKLTSKGRAAKLTPKRRGSR